MVKVKKNPLIKAAATPITIFEGCSQEDVEHAKSFWKSLTLQPPLESRLVSADIKQRLRVAPAHSQPKQVSKPEKDFHLLTENEMFLYQAREKEMVEKRNEYRRLSNNRTQIINMLHQQRARRIEKEEISKNIQ